MAIDINVPSQVKTYANLAAFPVTGSLKTIFIAEDTNKTYRWTGSVYVEVSAAGATGITIGTTAITSGTVGRVLFEGTGNVVQESANLFWDNTNGRLGIGTSTGTSKINLPDAGTTASDGIAFGNGANIFKNASNGISLFSGSGTWQFNSAILVLPTNQATFIRMASNRNLLIDNGTTTFASINGTTGNVLIGTTTDAGFKLDVNGTARVKGASNISTTTAFTIANSDSTNLLQVQDNGYIRIGSQGTSAFRVYATDASGDSEPSGLNLVLNSRVVSQSTAAGIGMVTINGIAGTATTGNQSVFLISKGFSPTSGTATYTATSIIPTINQTGGANGAVKGFYYNPTVTSVLGTHHAFHSTSGRIRFENLPTSPAGLSSGDVWNNLGILTIV